MSNDIEYIEPTQEHVGQMVEIKNGDTWEPRRLLVVLPDSQEVRFICQHKSYERDFTAWRHARIPRPLTYAERQAKCGLKVGDRVKFARAWEGDDNGSTTDFVHSMESYIGKIGFITSMSKSSCCVHFDGGGYWYFPYFVLEKVEDRVATQNDCGATVYVDGAPQDEFRIIVLWQEVDSVWRAVVRSGDKLFVYELSNLRVKE